MEIIQSAIAKARADRANATAVDASTTSSTGPAAAVASPALEEPLTLGPEVGLAVEALSGRPKADPSAVASRWEAVPVFYPSPAQMARRHIVTFSAGKEGAQVDMLRTRLLQLMRANGWRRVAITSPGPACGKSTLALNLAVSLGRQSSQSTLLLEMDLRRPSLAKMLGLREKHQFARVLEGHEFLKQNAVRIGGNLIISTQFSAARRPAELLHGPSTAAALALIDAEYDPAVILCDLPPLFATDDAMAVMGQMDAAIIVAAAETTTIKEIDRCEREIAAQTNVIGVVLNKCRHMEKDYGYDYYGA